MKIQFTAVNTNVNSSEIKDTSVDELLAQLVAKAPAAPTPNTVLTKELLETFLLQNAGKLVKSGVDLIEEMKASGAQSPQDAEGIEALAKLYTGVSAAVAELNKIYTNTKNNEMREKLKIMDIDSKKVLQQVEIQGNLLMSREALMKEMFKKADTIIDITPPQERLT